MEEPRNTYCTACGNANVAVARFCSSCGAPQAAVRSPQRRVQFCTSCGETLSDFQTSCDNCGAEVRAQPTSGLIGPDTEFAGFWIRLAAQVLDGIILITGSLLLGIFGAFVPILGLLSIPVFLYVFYKEIKCQTPGRSWLKVRVVDKSGEPISFWRGLLRGTIVWYISLIPS